MDVVVPDVTCHNVVCQLTAQCVVVYDYENGCHGAYSDPQKEYIYDNKDEYFEEDDSDEAMLARLREEDVKDFILGSRSQYTNLSPLPIMTRIAANQTRPDCDY